MAVADGERDLTYAALAAEAAGVLGALRAEVARRGIPAGAPLGLLPGHDAAAVAALLAVVVSGHPVVVLDPRTPVARLRRFAIRAGVRLCLADPDRADVAAQVAPAALTVAPASGDPATLWADPPDPGSPAVLAFTSGSTGVPKVVVNDHRMLVRDAWVNSAATGCYTADDVIAHTLPIAFHAGLMATVAGVLVGATMRMYDVRSAGVGDLAAWLDRAGATVMHASPAILRAFTGTGPDPARLARLRSLTIAGEAAHGKDVEATRRLLPPQCVLRNRYGSSETGLIAEFAVPVGHPPLEGALPVGSAVGDTVLGLIGPDGAPVAPGEAGTVTVTASAMATGYWDDPEATAAAFADAGDGRRTYRTSDVGRFDAEGRLHLLGRRDHSVKIRGYLVEPGEVDAALFGISGIKEAVTVGRPRPGDGLMRLVAYVVPDTTRPEEERPRAVVIRQALHEKLPSYMVPERIVLLDALPRTERGKLDRAALPDPPAPAAAGDTDELSEWETAVANVWTSVLALPGIGPGDDFFELGGDSLAAESLVGRMVADLGVPAHDISTAVLVAAPTLREFAARVRRRPARGERTLIPVKPEGTLPPLFVAVGGGALGVSFVPFARHLEPEQPLWALQAHGLERRAVPDWSVRAIARRNVAAIRSVQPHGPYHLAGHSFGGLVALETAHLLRRAGEDVALLVVLDSFPPDPDLYPGPEPLPPVQRFKDLMGLALTGIRGTPGAEQCWRFYRQSMTLHRRYRGAPYPGETLVVVADSPEQEIRAAWGPYLTGPWRLERVSGDHISLIREPFAAETAAVVTAALRAVRDGRALGRPGGVIVLPEETGPERRRSGTLPPTGTDVLQVTEGQRVPRTA